MRKHAVPQTVRVDDSSYPRWTRHFRSAAARRRYERGTISLDEAARMVRTWRGASVRDLRAAQQAERYAEKLRVRGTESEEERAWLLHEEVRRRQLKESK